MKNIIIFDTEYTSWKGCNENGWEQSKNQFQEIIQISAIKYSFKENKIIEEFDQLVKPELNKKLSDYIQDLTGIKQKVLDNNGVSFNQAMLHFHKFVEYSDCYSYGNDFLVLDQNFKLLGQNNFLFRCK